MHSLLARIYDNQTSTHITECQQMFSSSICLRVRLAYVSTDKRYPSCGCNNAISFTPHHAGKLNYTPQKGRSTINFGWPRTTSRGRGTVCLRVPTAASLAVFRRQLNTFFTDRASKLTESLGSSSYLHYNANIPRPSP